MGFKEFFLSKPSAYVPIIMSLAALSLLIGYVVLFGASAPQQDEGTAAHIFQLLMGGQAIVVLLFVTRYVLQYPKLTLQVFALQIFAAIFPFALLFWFER